MSATNTDAADRLMVRYATLKLGVASADEMYTVLECARDKARKCPPAEDPKGTATAAFLAGCDFYEAAARSVRSGSRGEVMAAAREWLEDVIALTDEQYRLTVAAWSKRAKAARESNAASAFQPRARA